MTQSVINQKVGDLRMGMKNVNIRAIVLQVGKYLQGDQSHCSSSG